MKKLLILSVAGLLLAASCGQKKVEYGTEGGAVRAVVTEGRSDWRLTDSLGNELVTGYDSMRVVEVGDDGHPMTVCYCKGNERLWYQFYSTMALRSEGRTADGLREGRWVFYHPNGMRQAEATFEHGLEEGSYTVFRESGVPYYRGQYSHGKPCGTWEFYAPDGSLDGTKQYDTDGTNGNAQ